MEKDQSKDETLPPGFRFHPTDEELITCYLINKISDAEFTARAITDVDLNKCEPWDLPGKAKMGEKEWYFFSLRDRKYPTGVRTNRATNTGYWKTTGKDKEIFNSQASDQLVGMKKTLVFYRGRAPRGEKTNWVMHEYRLHSKSSYRTTKDEWVVCRVFQKNAGAKKFPTSSNQSRAINPYNPDIMAPSIHPAQMLHSSDQNIAFQHQFPIGISRTSNNYLSNAELAELSRVYRSSNHSTNVLNNNNNNNINQLPMSMQMQAQLNYPQFNGGGPAGSSFTISGLNLNLGGGSGGASSSVPQYYRSAAGVAMNVEHGGAVSSLDHHHQAAAVAANYGVDMSSNGNVGRFMNMQEQADHLDNYWSPY